MSGNADEEVSAMEVEIPAPYHYVLEHLLTDDHLPWECLRELLKYVQAKHWILPHDIKV